jgi:hypothetical protein
MIDWLVPLTSLVILPIVVLVAFVGCAFDPSGLPSMDPVLRYPEGLQAGSVHPAVFNMLVDFTIEQNGASETVSVSRANAEIDNTGGEISVSFITADFDEEADYTCVCTITILDNPENTVEPALSAAHHMFEPGDLAPFELIRHDDGSFDLT